VESADLEDVKVVVRTVMQTLNDTGKIKNLTATAREVLETENIEISV